MGNYWALSAGKDGELWSAFWLERKIALGWSSVGDLRLLQTREAISEKYREVYAQYKVSPQGVGNNVGQLLRFYKDIQPDDTVFVRSHGMLIGIAKVVGDYDFIPVDDPLRKKFYSPFFRDDYPHVRPVHWLSLSGAMKQPLAVTRVTEMTESTDTEETEDEKT